MTPSPNSRRDRRALLGVFVTATVLAGCWIAVLAYGAARLGPVARGAFVSDYDGRVLDDGLELLIIQSDGQAYATLARDPVLDRAVEGFRTEAEAAYRAQRPLLGWLAWAVSVGRSGWVPPALAALSAAGTGLAAAGAGALLLHRRRSPWLALLILLLPGTGSTLAFLGPEPLVLGLALWGIVAWERDRTLAAVALFVLAVLGRESAILVPLVLGAAATRHQDWRRAIPLLAVPAALAGWFSVLQLRLGAWPWEAGEGRLGPPLVGFMRAVDVWTEPTQNAAIVGLGALVVTGAVALRGRDPLTWIVVAHVAFALFMGEYVWVEADFFGRVLLPLYAIGLLAVVAGLNVGVRTDTSVETRLRETVPLGR